MTNTEAIRHLGALSTFANADEVKAVEMAIDRLADIKPSRTIENYQQMANALRQELAEAIYQQRREE